MYVLFLSFFLDCFPLRFPSPFHSPMFSSLQPPPSFPFTLFIFPKLLSFSCSFLLVILLLLNPQPISSSSSFEGNSSTTLLPLRTKGRSAANPNKENWTKIDVSDENKRREEKVPHNWTANPNGTNVMNSLPSDGHVPLPLQLGFQNDHRLVRKSFDEDTAPPESVTPELSSEEDGRTEISDDFLRRLSAQQVANKRAKLHRGGNLLRGPVDFEEALRVTVPYEEAN